MTKQTRLGARALVIGGGMVGLAVARALSESFDEVQIVERDDLAGGMSIGVTSARILRDELRKRPSLEHLGKRLYPQLKRFAYPYWRGTALNDVRWPGTTGKRPLGAGALAARVARAIALRCAPSAQGFASERPSRAGDRMSFAHG